MYTSICINFQIKASSDNKAVVDLEVQQCHFPAWPDHGVPDHVTSILSFHECLHMHQKRMLGIPVLVHCRYTIAMHALIIIWTEIHR